MLPLLLSGFDAWCRSWCDPAAAAAVTADAVLKRSAVEEEGEGMKEVVGLRRTPPPVGVQPRESVEAYAASKRDAFEVEGRRASDDCVDGCGGDLAPV